MVVVAWWEWASGISGVGGVTVVGWWVGGWAVVVVGAPTTTSTSTNYIHPNNPQPDKHIHDHNHKPTTPKQLTTTSNYFTTTTTTHSTTRTQTTITHPQRHHFNNNNNNNSCWPEFIINTSPLNPWTLSLNSVWDFINCLQSDNFMQVMSTVWLQRLSQTDGVSSTPAWPVGSGTHNPDKMQC